MAAIWPVSLPQYSLIGATEQLPQTLLMTEMEAGIPKRRNRYTAGIRPLEIPLKLTNVQANVFAEFFEITLKNGALPFEWKLPRTGATVEFQFRKAPKLNNYSLNSVGPMWQVMLDLEILASGSAPSTGTIVPFSVGVTAGQLTKTITHNIGTATHRIHAICNWLTAIAFASKAINTTVLNFDVEAPGNAIVEGTVEL
jgi:hypothetical protein